MAEQVVRVERVERQIGKYRATIKLTLAKLSRRRRLTGPYPQLAELIFCRNSRMWARSNCHKAYCVV